MRHLVIGQREKARNFSAFHWSPHGSLVSIGQNFVTTRVVHLPKRTETSLITESDQSGPYHQLLQLCTVRTAWSDSDQAVRAVHSCKSWLSDIMFHNQLTVTVYLYVHMTDNELPVYVKKVILWRQNTLSLRIIRTIWLFIVESKVILKVWNMLDVKLVVYFRGFKSV